MENAKQSKVVKLWENKRARQIEKRKKITLDYLICQFCCLRDKKGFKWVL